MTHPLMTYIKTDPKYDEHFGPVLTPVGARKYTGSVATGYDAKRVESPKWAAEQEIIESIIDLFDNGSKVLDVPVGTGRFIPAYERNDHEWFGIDLSVDMAKCAADKATREELGMLMEGNVTELDKIFGKGDVFDLSIMCRLTRWLSPEQRAQALHQLQRVTKSVIVFTARIANHPYAYRGEDIEGDVLSGPGKWQIARNIECGEPDYRVIVLERAE